MSRFIPAHAGNTKCHERPPPLLPVHPRPRGEHKNAPPKLDKGFGSSPPTRGTRSDTRTLFHRLPVHPRPRGEHVSVAVAHICRYGSSPPTRGTRMIWIRCPVSMRFIPAHAGNTLVFTLSSFACAGSSPPTRGTHQMCRSKPIHLRFIPAHAGNTERNNGAANRHAVHPRPRGEHCPTPPNTPFSAGSSPPTRGTRMVLSGFPMDTRFIPAHAGNTFPHYHNREHPPVHPRPRGEHVDNRPAFYSMIGSSPPTRGTR